MVLVAREYVNTTGWRANLSGICATVKSYLQSKNAYNIMHLSALLNNTDSQRSGVSTRTAQRWLTKLGWIYGRNKKGYCDGHEREDVVCYREQVFCLKMKVSSANKL